MNLDLRDVTVVSLLKRVKGAARLTAQGPHSHILMTGGGGESE